MKINGIDKKKFEEDGYLLLRNFFRPEEISELRRNALAIRPLEAQKGNQLTDPAVPQLTYFIGDILGKPGIDHLVFDDRIISVAKELLGEEVIYFGDSNFQIGQGCRGLHKDCVDRSNPTGPDWQSPYNIIRMGIYLQDHSVHSGGVKVRKKSHLFPNTKDGELFDVPSCPGDLVLWKLTTTHSGNVVRLRFPKTLALDVPFENRVPNFLKCPEQAERVGIFLTYAGPGEHLENYLKNYFKRGDYFEHWRRSRADQMVEEMAVRKKVVFRKPTQDYGFIYARERHAEIRPAALTSHSSSPARVGIQPSS